jgi:hypothetical protein
MQVNNSLPLRPAEADPESEAVALCKPGRAPGLAVPTERPSPRRVWPQIRGLQPLCVPVPPASARISPLFLDSREAGPRAPLGQRQSRPVDVAEEGPLRRNECTLRGKGGKRSDRNLDLYQARVGCDRGRWLDRHVYRDYVAVASRVPQSGPAEHRANGHRDEHASETARLRNSRSKRACLMSGPPGRCTLTSNPAAICPEDTARCR